MKWMLTSLSLVFVLFSFGVMMAIKNDVRGLAQEARALQTEQKEMRATLHLLKAEQAYAYQSSAVEKFVPKLHLSELNPKQLRRFEVQPHGGDYGA